MGQIIVGGLEDAVTLRLQERATRHGQSMEAEARDILRAALHDEGCDIQLLGTWIAVQFADIGLKPDETLERPAWGEFSKSASESRAWRRDAAARR